MSAAQMGDSSRCRPLWQTYYCRYSASKMTYQRWNNVVFQRWNNVGMWNNVRISNVVLRLKWGCFWKLKQRQDSNQTTMLYQCWNNVIPTKINVVPIFKQHHSNLKTTLFQHWNNVIPTVETVSFQPENNVDPMLKQRHSNLKTMLFQSWNNVISTWKQHWSWVEILIFVSRLKCQDYNVEIWSKTWH